ncbi:MAG: hypothetical protein ABFS16_10150 [Bacteroidota bacterium]
MQRVRQRMECWLDGFPSVVTVGLAAESSGKHSTVNGKNTHTALYSNSDSLVCK